MNTVPVQNLIRSPARDPLPAAPANGSARGNDSSASVQSSAAPAAQPALAATDTQQRAAELGQESLQQALAEFEQRPAVQSRSLSFVVNEDTGRTIVSVFDRETDELIRQIPSEEIIRIAKALQDLREQSGSALTGSGLLLDDQA